MVDGVKLTASLSDFEKWKLSTGLNFSRSVYDTGEIKARTRAMAAKDITTITHKANVETYNLTVKETITRTIDGNEKTCFYLYIEGSLHKNHFKGQNYSSFTFGMLLKEISHLEQLLQLPGNQLKLSNIEIGVNIPLAFAAYQFLTESLVLYKGLRFYEYLPDSYGVSLGYHCSASQYEVKLYDKGLQYSLTGHLMRFELRYKKMQIPNKCNIYTLADLRDINKVKSFAALLPSAWEHILLYDTAISSKESQLEATDWHLIQQGKRYQYWHEVKKESARRFKYYRNKFRNLVKQYGEGWNEKIKQLIIGECEALLKNCTNLPTGKNADLSNFTIKVKGKYGQSTFEDETEFNEADLFRVFEYWLLENPFGGIFEYSGHKFKITPTEGTFLKLLKRGTPVPNDFIFPLPPHSQYKGVPPAIRGHIGAG